MRLITQARVLFVLLAFQLAFGLQPAIVSAAAPQQVDSHVACPEHSGHGALDSAQAPTTTKLAQHPLTHDPSTQKHNCCKSSGCQGHCGSLPLALTSTAVRRIRDTSLIRSALTQRSASAPPDTLFRPPIAS